MSQELGNQFAPTYEHILPPYELEADSVVNDAGDLSRYSVAPGSLASTSSLSVQQISLEQFAQISTSSSTAVMANPQQQNEPNEGKVVEKNQHVSYHIVCHTYCTYKSRNPLQTETYAQRRARFTRTAHILSRSGLLEVTLQTAQLLRKNHALQKEMTILKQQTQAFVEEVLDNPQNRWLKERFDKK